MSVVPLSPADIICMVFILFEAFVSIVIHMFIMFCLLNDYYLKKKFTSVQKMHILLNISGTLFIVVSTLHVISNNLQPEFFSTTYYNVVFTLLLINSLCSSSWLTAVLCFYYFIKIVNVQRGFLGWMKKKISSVVHWLIVVVMVFSFFNSLTSLFLYTSHHLPPTNSSVLLSTSVTSEQTSINDVIAKFILLMIFIPLVSTELATLLTVGFLKIHSHKMKSTKTSGESSLTLYKEVVYKMIRFLVLYSVYYLIIFLYYFSVFPIHSAGYYINLMLMFSFTPVQFVVHTLDNHNLRNTWKEMIGCIRRCLE
ncbi:taste receptor type 2 member 39-like [Leptodactylus fuscus]|uniref:taste receptor type 2 member 39-like n=1 Tax=Leptodactylus fuscus TaxID=238119 RepID=UPI003F4EE16A